MNTFGFVVGFCFMGFDVVVLFFLAMIFRAQILVKKKKNSITTVNIL